MKIRTITLGISGIPTSELITWCGQQLERAVDHFTLQGYTVQTKRLSLERWDVGIGLLTRTQRADLLQVVNALCTEFGIDFCSIGVATNAEQIEHMAHLLTEFPRLSACADVGCEQRGLNNDAIHAAAQAVRYLAANSDKGFGNFRFGAGFCLKADNPFFPGAYHQSELPAFTIGLENSDILVEAFHKAEKLELVPELLFELLLSKLHLVEKSALDLADSLAVPFGGIDTSIAPSLHPDESIVRAFRGVNVEFGRRGTLAACGMVTDVVKSLPIKRLGYCGIMLPVLEDVGLAELAGEGQLGITDLIAYSSVCGVGVDMVPIPGDASIHQLEALMLDVGVMAIKLKKPLSVRLLAVPGKAAGERTQFESPYICNSKVMAL